MFFDVLQYIHNNLDIIDKFAKAQLLFKISNGNCLKNFIPNHRGVDGTLLWTTRWKNAYAKQTSEVFVQVMGNSTPLVWFWWFCRYLVTFKIACNP